MAALNAETLFVSFLSADPRCHSYELELLREVSQKRLAHTRVVIAPGHNNLLRQETDHVL
jgi:hypothetical protein